MCVSTPAPHLSVAAGGLLESSRDPTLRVLDDAGTPPYDVVLEAREGRSWAAEVHSGPLQLVAALFTRLQLLRRRLAGTEAESVGHLVELAGAAITDLRDLMARLEPPDGDDSLVGALQGSAYRVLGADVDVGAPAATLTPPARGGVLTLSHRALLQLRRMGGRAPGRIEVDVCGLGVAVWIQVANGGGITRREDTLADRARLAGGSAQVVARASDLVATIVLPHPAVAAAATG